MSPRQLVIKLLDRLERTNAYADLLLNKELKEQELSELDRALIQEFFFWSHSLAKSFRLDH